MAGYAGAPSPKPSEPGAYYGTPLNFTYLSDGTRNEFQRCGLLCQL